MYYVMCNSNTVTVTSGYSLWTGPDHGPSGPGPGSWSLRPRARII